MRSFPTDLLKPLNVKFSGDAESANFEIKLAPFLLNGENVDTVIRLNDIKLPSTDPAKLEKKSFWFPINPKPGYIDGSVYIRHAHHPVDVTLIEFGSYAGEVLPVTLEAKFLFEFEGLDDFANTSCTIPALIQMKAG